MYKFNMKRMMANSKGTVYLFGDPVVQSLSPHFHRAVFRGLGLPWQFSVIESRNLQDLEHVIQQPDFLGCAVTLPNKVTAMKVVDELSDAATILGSVNTIHVQQRDNRKILIGTSTDWIGMQAAILAQGLPVEKAIQERGALVVGSGALCRAAVYSLIRGLGASNVYLVSIQEESKELQDTIQHLGKFGLKTSIVRNTSLDQIPPAVIVNTYSDTVLRSEQASTTWELLASIIRSLYKQPNFQRRGVILDMFNRQSEKTKVVREAEEAGWSTASFMDFMAFQAIEQDILWTGKPVGQLPFDEARMSLHR